MNSVLIQVENIKDEIAEVEDHSRIRFRQGAIAALRDILQTTYEEVSE